MHARTHTQTHSTPFNPTERGSSHGQKIFSIPQKEKRLLARNRICSLSRSWRGPHLVFTTSRGTVTKCVIEAHSPPAANSLGYFS